MLRFQLFLLLFCLGTLCLYGQEKYERESRIKKEDVPLAAQDFVNKISVKKKIKWYAEEGLSHFSFEAKFKFNNSRYSIEFDTLGQLEDVELLIKEEAISPTTLAKIEANLDDLFKIYHIQKKQLQYKGEKEVLQTLIQTGEASGSYTTNFEFVVRGRTEEGVYLYEMLFDEEGQLLQQNKILLKNANHLEY